MFKRNTNFGFIVGVKEEYDVTKYSNYHVKIAYGAKNAREAAKVLCKKVKCIVSFGFAASVDSELTNGEIVIPKFLINKRKEKKLLSSKYRSPILRKLSEQKVNERAIFSVDKIINKKESKINIYKEFKASSIDMESYSISKVCFHEKIPLIVVRVIFDDLSFNIPDYIVKNTNVNGKLSVKNLSKFLLLNPHKVFNLMKLCIYYLTAKKKLKKIFKKCF